MRHTDWESGDRCKSCRILLGAGHENPLAEDGLCGMCRAAHQGHDGLVEGLLRGLLAQESLDDSLRYVFHDTRTGRARMSRYREWA